MMKSPPRQGVVVLGMHRSGTSMVTHIMGGLGCSFGGELMSPKPDNPLGHWEHACVVDAHDAFLAVQTRSWDDARPWDAAHFASREALGARRQLREIFERDFVHRPLWVLKDPRQCRLLPLWDEIFADEGTEIHFLHVLRDPRAVARSLARRNGLSFAHALVLWLRHYLESELFTRNHRRGWLCFEAMVADPEATLRKVCSQAGLTEHLDLRPAGEVARKVVAPSHVHHRGDESAGSEDPDTLRWVFQAYETMVSWEDGESPEGHRELDRIATVLGAADALFHEGLVVPFEARLRELADENDAMHTQLEDVAAYTRGVEKEVDAMRTQLEKATSYARNLEEEIAAKNQESQRVETYVRRLEQTIADR